MLLDETLQHASDIIQQGGIIAYPTEGVYGLGCDPFNQQAVQKILSLKQRSVAKGLLVIAADWQQVVALTTSVDSTLLQNALIRWSQQPVTFLFPHSDTAPAWITGDSDSIGLRLTLHPVAKRLCELAGPLVSTSANVSGHIAARTAAEVRFYFPVGIDVVIDAPIGDLNKPTPIIDVVTGQAVRE